MAKRARVDRPGVTCWSLSLSAIGQARAAIGPAQAENRSLGAFRCWSPELFYLPNAPSPSATILATGRSSSAPQDRTAGRRVGGQRKIKYAHGSQNRRGHRMKYVAAAILGTLATPCWRRIFLRCIRDGAMRNIPGGASKSPGFQSRFPDRTLACRSRAP
jgi:hypothetical protein